MAKFTEFYFDSATKKNKIRVLKCEPDGDIKGVVQIAHGIAEHIDRYKDFMEFLANNGFVCVGDDHLGHGKTFTTEDEKGAFCENDGWNTVVKDLVTLSELTKKDYPDKKYILFGHSMGSFLMRTFLIDHPDKYDMAIISGTGHQPKFMITMGNFIAKSNVKKSGYISDGTKLNKLTMGNYLAKIENPKTPCDWLSRDENEVQKYFDDELCGFTAKAGLYKDMLGGIAYIINPQNIAKMNKEKPILFVSGDSDPVGEYGKGVKRAYEAFKNAGVKNLSIKLYEGGRHEMLNETNKLEVYNDILEFIK